MSPGVRPATTMPSKNISVLIVEDSPSFAELLIEELRRGGYSPTALRVDTADQTATALAERRWDLVFADSKLPAFRGTDVVRMLEERCLDTPVIVVSGTIDEEDALDALRAGAKDFVPKDRLTRLLPSVERELAAAASRAERRRSELRYRRLVEHLPLVTYIDALDATSSNLYSSPQVEQMLGYSPDEWRSDPELFVSVVHPADRDRVLAEIARAHAENEPLRTEYRVLAKNGEVRWLRDEAVVVADDDSGEPYLLGFLLDVTEQRRLEREVLELQQLEALSRLAAGVGHDFNNMLTAVRGAVALGRTELDRAQIDGARLWELLGVIDDACARAAVLTRSLVDFGRAGDLDERSVDVNLLLTRIGPLLRSGLGRAVTLTLRPSPYDCTVKADPARLEQAIFNLVLNAHAAMPDGGRISIRVEVADDVPAAQLPPGRYARISVVDTGVGMDEATRARIFEPYFSTKGANGTGLGLATVHGFVRQSGGAIVVDSEPGRGTTVHLYLPEGASAAER